MKKNNIIILVSIILVAGLGSLFTQLGMEWFGGLNRPTEWVPAFIFPVVWTTIYLLFAFTLIRLNNQKKLTKKAVVLLIINGIMNVLWCLVFFTFNQLLIGNIVIVLNLIVGILLYVEMSKIEPLSGYLIALYPIWLCLATTLNNALWILN